MMFFSDFTKVHNCNIRGTQTRKVRVSYFFHIRNPYNKFQNSSLTGSKEADQPKQYAPPALSKMGT